jgi:recombinational DNA repair protein RecT
MKMLNLNNDVTQACFQFEYKGYIVSCSNSAQKRKIRVIVFKGELDFWEFLSVEKAIDFINNQFNKGL